MSEMILNFEEKKEEVRSPVDVYVDFVGQLELILEKLDKGDIKIIDLCDPEGILVDADKYVFFQSVDNPGEALGVYQSKDGSMVLQYVETISEDDEIQYCSEIVNIPIGLLNMMAHPDNFKMKESAERYLGILNIFIQLIGTIQMNRMVKKLDTAIPLMTEAL